MKTPSFWSSKNIVAFALLPFSFAYGLGRKWKVSRAKPVQVSVPVICVGNLTAGGAGKTPVTMHIGKLLKAEGVRAFFLSRGYGGNIENPTLVDTTTHTAKEVGDEPLMLAEILPTIVSKDRLAGAQFAIAQGAELIVMDDGLQNTSLAKTLSLVVMDGTRGFGNGYLLPAGPLREPVSVALEQSDALIVINSTETVPIPPAKAVLTASTSPVYAGFVKDKRWLAFCGIAYPDKFFATLHNLGGHVVATRPYSDHHPYSASDVKALKQEALNVGAGLITTAKDLVRIPTIERSGISVVNIAVQFDDEAKLASLIANARAAA